MSGFSADWLALREPLAAGEAIFGHHSAPATMTNAKNV